MSQLDVRKHSEYARALSRIPQIKLRPLVGSHDLEEIAIITGVIPELSFPINSAGEFLDQIGEDKTLSVMGMDVDPVRMIKYMPAYYFPIVSYENLVEKMADLMHANRRRIDIPAYTEKIKEKMKEATFPIRTPEEMERLLWNTPSFNIGGRTMHTRKIIAQLPHDFFPVRDLGDLEAKSIRYLITRPLIEKDR